MYMEALSRSEENYLKSIFSLSTDGESVSTRRLARDLSAKDSSVTDMLKRLARKGLIHYKKYHGVSLTEEGRPMAIKVIRRHRLWEVFLVEKLGFKWDQVHEIAEQMEHIQSEELITRLDAFLGHPKIDPHGDPIPDEMGNIDIESHIVLAEAEEGVPLKVIRVMDDSTEFLQYLDARGISIGDHLEITDFILYDQSLQIKFEGGKEIHLSQKVSENIVVMER